MASSISHIQSLRSSLQAEYLYEKEYFRQQKESVGLKRLISRGECWFPLSTGAVGFNSLGEMTIEVMRHDQTDVSDGLNQDSVKDNLQTKFEPQTEVTFFYLSESGSINYCRWNGFVSFVDGNRMVVVVPKNGNVSDVLQRDQLGVQLAFNERTYQLEFEALNKVEKAADGPLAHLREVLIGNLRPSFSSLSDLGFKWLNLSQEAAVNRVLNAKDVMIVHGPPGTGKTTTLLDAIYETLRREPQVLVCAQSNAAVDWIASQLLDRAVPVLRIGNPTKVTDRMLQQTYERQFADHPRYPELWSLRKMLREGVGTKGRLNHEAKDRLRDRLNELETEIRSELFRNAKVVACTLAGAGHPLMSGQLFHTLFIDEAAQATEPACWIAIRKARRVIMAGDHCQLSPTLKNPDVLHSSLAETLMEHVAKTKPEAVSLLTVQYRMHPDIMQFSSDYFYDGKLTAADSVQYRGALDMDSALIWFDTSDTTWQEAEQHDGTSRYNVREAQFLVAQMEAYAEMLTLRRLEDDHVDIAVISPYQAQIHLLRRLIKRSPKLRPYRHAISVETVDAFQGQERDIVMISLVRANDSGQIGFLQDLRRMNVALTRARHKVMIVGNSLTLGRYPFYRKLYEHVEKVGRVVSVCDTE